ncbi:MAG: cyclic nucleotide-binding domain-containing protein [Calditrichaeota bacterium]|nr:cyclic nucleotide-binding domain-containing protein [Calditrichota bacterium]
MENLEKILAQHPFFKDMSPEHVAYLAGCAANARYDPGDFIFRNGQPANQFFLIRYGKVSLEIFVPGKGAVMIETVQEGNVMGWSWLVPPYRWHFDARALELTRAIVMDGECLRKKCAEDPRLGYELMSRIARLIEERLRATQLQLIDIYGKD